MGRSAAPLQHQRHWVSSRLTKLAREAPCNPAVANEGKTGPGGLAWPEFKERLYFQLACDRNLSGWDYRVGIVLIAHINSEELSAWPSYETMAALLGVPGENGIRQAKRAVERLIAKGHFQLTHRGGGRGCGQHRDSNRYIPILKDPSRSPLRVTDRSPLSTATGPLTVTTRALKGDKSGPIRVTDCPPEPEREPLREPERRGSASLASPPEGGSARSAAHETPQQNGNRTTDVLPSMRPRRAQQTGQHRRLWADVNKLDPALITRIIDLPNGQHDRALAAERDTPHSGVLVLLKAVEASAQAPKPGPS